MWTTQGVAGGKIMEVDCCFTNENNWFRYRTGAIIIEDSCILFAENKSFNYLYTIGGGVHINETSESCVKREVLEETGIEYEIDHLSVICENFFKGHGRHDNKNCHCLELYFFMKSKGSKKLNENSINADGEKEFLRWIPLNEIKTANIRPSFLKDKIYEIIESKNAFHIITYIDN